VASAPAPTPRARALLPLPGNEDLAAALARRLGWPLLALETREFPDGETYLRVESPCEGLRVALVCTLDRPDRKLLPLLFAADLLRDLGAVRVGLAAPYLAYLRQDRRFRDGEALTSKSFATLLSSRFDWLVTLDPHLHRYRSLDEIYTIPSCSVSAAPALADWISAQVPQPLLVGPDAESEQWVSEVARRCGAPWIVARKTRRGDREVEIALPSVSAHRERTPVVLDDIVSSGRTLAECVRALRAACLAAPVCVAVHGVFAGDAEQALAQAGAARVVTTRSVAHASNAIEIDALLAPAIGELSG
jgi:ribose-phosphate pyrophosphokinase